MKYIYLIKLLFLTTIIFLPVSCAKKVKSKKNTINNFKIVKCKSPKKKIVYIQPLGDVDTFFLNRISKNIDSFYNFNSKILKTIELKKDYLAKSKIRYDASLILKMLDSKKNILLVTEKDIVTKDGIYGESGIFGLGHRPGNTCIVSTFRLKKYGSKNLISERIVKVALHELGHNLGLEHCTNNDECFMDGKSATLKEIDLEKKWLCEKCSKKLNKKNPL